MTRRRTVTVSGQGIVYGQPDLAHVTLGVATEHLNLSTAYDETARVMTTLIDALQGVGIARSDILTAGLQVYQQPPRETRDGVQRPRPYVAQQLLHVTVRETGKLSAVLTAAVDGGANIIQDVSFTVADPEALASLARAAAVADAHNRARELASALNMTVGKPLSIREMSGTEAIVALESRRSGFLASKAPMPVEPGLSAISYQVRIIFSLESGSE